MKIEILGTGCLKCATLEKNTLEAISKLDGFHEVKKVEDIVEIMNYGVMSTPALVVDKSVKSSGKVLSVDEVLEILKSSK
jgi:small redox-active disulfide protein 2